MTRQLLAILLLTFISGRVVSQQMPLYSQYMLNGFVFNPATAGHDGLTTLNLTTRQQWIGLDYAPRSVSFNVQTRVLMRGYMIKRSLRKGNKLLKSRKGRVGLGLNIYNDRNGNFTQSGGNVTYAYHVPLVNAQLSFGLSSSITQYKINSDNIRFRNEELHYAQLAKPIYVPDANAGIFYEGTNIYGGISAANILESTVRYGNSNLEEFKLKRQYFGMIGYRFDQAKDYVIIPSLLVKTNETLYTNIDISLKAEFLQKYWGGVSYRTMKSFIAFVGISRNNLSAGYAFDYNFNSFQQFTYGSHELNMSLRFGDSARRYKWLRRF